MTASHPIAEIQTGNYPPSVVSLIHSAAAHRSGRQARVQNAVANADRYAAAVGGRMYKGLRRRRTAAPNGVNGRRLLGDIRPAPASSETPGVEIRIKHKTSAPMHLKSYQIDGQLLRTGAANFSASGLKRIMI